MEDRLPVSTGGVTWHAKAGKWRAQVRQRGENHHLGVYTAREDAERAVENFREENPSTRLRKLDSVRRNHVRCYDERTLIAQRAQILDVMESGVKQLLKLTTASGKALRCSKDHAVFTPDGWRKAGELQAGDHVMVAGTAPRPSEALVPPSLRRGIGVWTSMQRKRLIKEQDACYLCSHMFPRDELELDHVVPVAMDLLKALDERNLAPACKNCHDMKSATEQGMGKRGGKIAVAKSDVVLNIEDDGEEMTYDLSVAGPWHNFLADGVVVHNSYNEESGRYRELQPVFYVPGEERKLVQQGRPGKYEFVAGTPEQHKTVGAAMEESYRRSYEAYQEMLAAGVAREVARAVLPVGLFSSMYATCNARSLMHFLSLRTKDERAKVPSFPQREIEMVAERMEQQWAELMPLTHAAFNAHGRVAP
ncbi:FAD-dependent thymidylate synthase [Peterkaempfera sp. SMS 1(5)a]|uniref:FAD-dependent thymidylate synthase n=1 Tax=Peterkaempfera podocarpi TaxID=3232308 RepID=UPI00366B074D